MINCAQILAWSAWAPGLADQAAWLAALRTHGADFGLLSSEYAPLNAAEPKAPAVLVPPMLRRRLSPLGRAAAEAAAPLLAAAEDKNLPWVYASRWGDLQLAVDSLESVAAGGTVSPAAFRQVCIMPLRRSYPLRLGIPGTSLRLRAVLFRSKPPLNPRLVCSLKLRRFC